MIKSGVNTTAEVKEIADKFNKMRNNVTFDILKQEHEEWKNLAANDARSLWEIIDWKGQVKSGIPVHHPPVEDISNHFETYRKDEKYETGDINQLESNIIIPILDDPITLNEVVSDAVSEMKKEGFDYPLPIIRIIYSMFSPLLVMLLNIMFFVKYPLDCATSLLFTIPKKGNLSISANYRGI